MLGDGDVLGENLRKAAGHGLDLQEPSTMASTPRGYRDLRTPRRTLVGDSLGGDVDVVGKLPDMALRAIMRTSCHHPEDR